MEGGFYGSHSRHKGPGETSGIIQTKGSPEGGGTWWLVGRGADSQAIGGVGRAGLGAQKSGQSQVDGFPAGDGGYKGMVGCRGHTPSAWHLSTGSHGDGSVHQATRPCSHVSPADKDGNRGGSLREARLLLSPYEPCGLSTGAFLVGTCRAACRCYRCP